MRWLGVWSAMHFGFGVQVIGPTYDWHRLAFDVSKIMGARMPFVGDGFIQGCFVVDNSM